MFPARSLGLRTGDEERMEAMSASVSALGLQVLAPSMEGFGRHVHDRLPLTRPESRSLLRSQDKST